MPRNIVICCDGTGNEVGNTISNVLKLYRILSKDQRQLVYYSPGIGTIGVVNAWQRMKQQTRSVFGLATGYGLDEDVLGAYRFLCEHYQDGDQVWLFGFSRGAYAVRVLAAFVHVIGLLAPNQVNLAGYAFSAYKKTSSDSYRDSAAGSPARSLALQAAWHFGRVAGTRPIRIAFIGVWDTVASIIVPRDDTFLPDLQTLRFTRTNPSVRVFRQAMSIDERRRMFRPNRWKDDQSYRPNPFDRSSEVPQDVRQVWFAGVHADIGGYPEAESGLSKFPLLWMIDEAAAQGLLINRAMVNHLVLGQPRKGSRHEYVRPDAGACLHDSFNATWRLLEWVPKMAKWREWPYRRIVTGFYLPRAEPRVIPDGAMLHQSVLDRMNLDPRYRPINLPKQYVVEAAPPNGPLSWSAEADEEGEPNCDNGGPD